MEQRRLRLGDTLDDYCPRERRVTNHAVVAMIEETIKQTRCTTCDAEHPYKAAKVPRRRKLDTPAALYRDVLAGKGETDTAPVLTASQDPEFVTPPTEKAPVLAESLQAQSIAADDGDRDDLPADDGDDGADAGPVEEGPVHRQLIRATLPRIEGHKEERRPTEFTIRQPGGRGGGSFRGGDPRMRGRAGNGSGGVGNGAGNTNRPHGGQRFSSAGPAGPSRGAAGRGGPAGNFRGGQGQGQPRQGGGGRKRSR